MIRKEDWKIKFQNFAWPGTLKEKEAVSSVIYQKHRWTSISTCMYMQV